MPCRLVVPHSNSLPMRKFVPWLAGGSALVLVACASPTAPTPMKAADAKPAKFYEWLCNGWPIRTGTSEPPEPGCIPMGSG